MRGSKRLSYAAGTTVSLLVNQEPRTFHSRHSAKPAARLKASGAGSCTHLISTMFSIVFQQLKAGDNSSIWTVRIG
eukprot:scaffold251067_cov25-Prasinocladus_malaysianus.AAC.1